jgi:2-dehydro-3-deoxygluconokinase
MLRIAAIGECMIELAPDGKGGWHLGFAGDSFNTLWTLRGLLGEAAATDFVSAFGDDHFSRQQIDFFLRHGIGTAASPRIAGGRPGLYAIMLDGAERSFTYWRSDSVARHLADDGPALTDSLRHRDLVYFSGITLAILAPPQRATLLAAIAAARSAGSRIAFDPNYRARLWPSVDDASEGMQAASRIADIVLPTFDDERTLFGDADPEATAQRLAALGVAECIVKNSADPAFLSADGETRWVEAAAHVVPIDTSGAGDAFNGGYLAARLRGRTPLEAAQFAHRIAALAIGQRGALTPLEKLKTALAA